MQIGKGESYSKIARVICIIITDYELFKGAADYLNHFRFYSRKNDLYFEEIPEEIYTAEIPKVPAESDGTRAWGWVRFLGARTREEFEMAAQTNTEIRKAVDLLYELSTDETVRAEFDRQQMVWMDHQALLEDHFAKGEAKGKLEML